MLRGLDDAGDHPLLRSLAGLAPRLDYPGGTIGQAYWLSEWLDCEFHHVGSSERAAADAFGRRDQRTVLFDETGIGGRAT